MQNILTKAMGSMPSANMEQKPDDVPWWMRYAGRGLGIIAGGLALILGIMTCISISPTCIIAGIFQMIAGFIILAIEAPCCCMFIDHVQRFSGFMEARPYWNKAAFYCILSLPGIVMCFGLATLFGSGFIFATGVVYGMMALGKKASREEMATSATRQPDWYKTTLVDNLHDPQPDLPSNSSLPPPRPPVASFPASTTPLPQTSSSNYSATVVQPPSQPPFQQPPPFQHQPELPPPHRDLGVYNPFQ